MDDDVYFSAFKKNIDLNFHCCRKLRGVRQREGLDNYLMIVDIEDPEANAL